MTDPAIQDGREGTRLKLTADLEAARGRCHYCPSEDAPLMVLEGGDEIVLICVHCLGELNRQFGAILEAARIRRMILEN